MQPAAANTEPAAEQQPAWWKSAVVYQIYPRSFADSDGDGIGDLPGVLGHLDYLAALGIDVIWMSPCYPSPMDDNGYDISDYQDVDPLFGTLADLDKLIEQAHERGIRIVLDLVVNHTSDRHPWFVESRSSREHPKRDWYWWRPPRPGTQPGEPGAEPTNWQSAFSGPAWEYDEASGEYFLHLFSRTQPDLNWENPQVRDAVHSMMRWWLDRGVDGFRMDVINLISKDPALPDGPLVDGGPLGSPWSAVVGGPRIHEFLQELNREVIAPHPGGLLTVGEMPGVTVQEAVLFTDPARAEMDMVFQFEHVAMGPDKWANTPPQLTHLKASFARWQEGLARVGWNSLYLSNHDQPRSVSRFGNDGRYRVESAKALATVLHLHRGTPYVFQGDELGMTNAGFDSIDDYRDIESLNHFAEATGPGRQPIEQVLAVLRAVSRDNARTPMQWDDSGQAGFTAGTPWIALNPNHTEINAAAATADPDSVWHHYRRLIELRHTEPVVVDGDFTMLVPDDEQLYAYLRRLDGVELLVLANLSDRPACADLPDAVAWAEADLLLTNYPDTATELRPWEARVHRRRGVRVRP